MRSPQPLNPPKKVTKIAQIALNPRVLTIELIKEKLYCEGSSKALEVDGRALEAVRRISKTAIKASEAGGSTSEAAGGRFGGQRMKLA